MIYFEEIADDEFDNEFMQRLVAENEILRVELSAERDKRETLLRELENNRVSKAALESLRDARAECEKWKGLALAKGGDGRTLAEIQRTENSLRAELVAEQQKTRNYEEILKAADMDKAFDGPNNYVHKAYHAQVAENLKAELADADERVSQLTSALTGAIDMLEFWGGYASEYFQTKHDLGGDVEYLRKTLEGDRDE